MASWTANWKRYHDAALKARSADADSERKAAMHEKRSAIVECFREDRVRTKDALTDGEREAARKRRAKLALEVEKQRNRLRGLGTVTTVEGPA